jgi:pantoate--beta-alanine ligase
MRIVRTGAEVRSALAESRCAGRTIGLVPTMGAFHEGHLSLMRRARADCEVVIVSLFVNPAQFNESRDLEAYPRDEARDAALATEAGVDLLFAPGVEQVYPQGFSTTVSVGALTEVLEGVQRGRSHFDGVTTVVTKLLNIVMPDVAYFGQKDAQQAVVIRRLVRDLDVPVRIEVCPIVRDHDGLALSSRNVLLSSGERTRALSLHRALGRIREAIEAGERSPVAARRVGLVELRPAAIDLEYLELIDTVTLAPVAVMGDEVLAVVAARVGTTRLIDNELIRVPSASAGVTDNPVATALAAPTR